MILTKKIIEQGRSENGGWSSNQLQLFGIKYPLKKGWVKLLIGKDFPEQVIKNFISLKNYHLNNSRVKRKQEVKNKQKKVIDHKKTNPLPVFIPCTEVIPFEKQYLHENWFKIRRYILFRDNRTCQDCQTKSKILQVHHLKYNWGGYVWEVDPKHLITLCIDCHEKRHGKTKAVVVGGKMPKAELNRIEPPPYYMKVDGDYADVQIMVRYEGMFKKEYELQIRRNDELVIHYTERLSAGTKRELQIIALIDIFKHIPKECPVLVRINSKFIENYFYKRSIDPEPPNILILLDELEEKLEGRQVGIRYARLFLKHNLIPSIQQIKEQEIFYKLNKELYK